MYLSVYSSDPFDNRCYRDIYDRSALDATDGEFNYYSHTTPLDITLSDSNSVCGSSSAGGHDDVGFGDCNCLECLETEKFDNDDYDSCG